MCLPSWSPSLIMCSGLRARITHTPLKFSYSPGKGVLLLASVSYLQPWQQRLWSPWEHKAAPNKSKGLFQGSLSYDPWLHSALEFVYLLCIVWLLQFLQDNYQVELVWLIRQAVQHLLADLRPSVSIYASFLGTAGFEFVAPGLTETMTEWVKY